MLFWLCSGYGISWQVGASPGGRQACMPASVGLVHSCSSIHLRRGGIGSPVSSANLMMSMSLSACSKQYSISNQDADPFGARSASPRVEMQPNRAAGMQTCSPGMGLVCWVLLEVCNVPPVIQDPCGKRPPATDIGGIDLSPSTSMCSGSRLDSPADLSQQACLY